MSSIDPKTGAIVQFMDMGQHVRMVEREESGRQGIREADRLLEVKPGECTICSRRPVADGASFWSIPTSGPDPRRRGMHTFRGERCPELLQAATGYVPGWQAMGEVAPNSAASTLAEGTKGAIQP